MRSTLVTLGLGVVAQRLLQLAAFLCIGRELGVERLGTYAMGLALAALLAVLAGAGIRNVLARAVARTPGSARSLVLLAVRSRLLCGAALVAPAIAAAFLATAHPWFWTLCLLQVLPAAFDLKHLLDASGRPGAEVAIETGASLLQLGLVALWLAAGDGELATLAAITLASRGLYALGAVAAIRRLPHAQGTAPQAPLFRRSLGVSFGQTAHELMTASDVWLVAMLFGHSAAGLYAVAARIAAAALLPSAQLARLLLPHLLRASAAGSPARTAATALRATAFATLPMCAGGAIVAEPLCALFGAEFTAAAPALRLVLAAGCLQHLGWQCSHMLFAAGRDAAYAAGLWWPAVLHALLLGAFAGGGDAAAAALAMLLAEAAYFAVGCVQVRTSLRGAARLWFAPVCVALATAGAAALPLPWLGGLPGLPLQLAAGGAAFAVGLWRVELRGRLRRIGDGLAAASGFHG